MRNNKLTLDIMETAFLSNYKSMGEVCFGFEHTWTSNNSKEGIKVVGDGQLGVLTLKDKEVLKAIIRLYISTKANNVHQKPTYEDLTLTVKSLTVVALEMGCAEKNVNGRLRKDMKESLARLLNCTLILPDNSQYRLLKEVNKSGNSYDITMDECLYTVIANSHNQFEIDDKASQIKNLLGRNIYETGYIIKDGKNKACVSMETLLKKFPMFNRTEDRRVRVIKEEAEKLNQYSFVKTYVNGDMVEIQYI